MKKMIIGGLIAVFLVTLIGAPVMLCVLQLDKHAADQTSNMKALDGKLDAIAQHQEEINRRLDELEQAVDSRADGNTDTVNRILKNISDLKEDVQQDLREVDERINEIELSYNKEKTVTVAEEKPVIAAEATTAYTPTTGLTKRGGVNYYGENGEQKETYYNLPMSGVIGYAQAAGIDGEYWVREDGAKMYGEYIIIAANQEVHPYGSTVETSLGTGIVLDTGSFAAGNPNQVDIATDW